MFSAQNIYCIFHYEADTASKAMNGVYLTLTVYDDVTATLYDVAGVESGASPAVGECSLVNCQLHCQHGRRLDDSGCEICQCNDPPE